MAVEKLRAERPEPDREAHTRENSTRLTRGCGVNGHDRSCSPQSLREVVFKRPLSWWPGGKKEVSITMRYAKFMLAPAAAGAALILSSQSARADFSGAYDPANWTLFNSTVPLNPPPGSFTGNGFVNITGAPASISLTGSDGPNVSGAINTDYTIAAAGAGTWSFDWSYTTLDSASGFDPAFYLLNGTPTTLISNSATTGSGSVSITVNAGDVIGFRIRTLDNSFGPGTVTITNFVAPVPAPGSLALLGLAAVSRRSRRRRC
jgi:hypothetical protein